MRGVGMVEAISFLVLLCLAMPLKYLSDYPDLGNSTVSVPFVVQAVEVATVCAAASGRAAPPRCVSAADSSCGGRGPAGGTSAPG